MSYFISRQFDALLVVLLVTILVNLCDCKCDFEAIFNFGDSNTDTGEFNTAFPEQRPPNGMTYFKKPVGRASDGRVILDFLGKKFFPS